MLLISYINKCCAESMEEVFTLKFLHERKYGVVVNGTANGDMINVKGESPDESRSDFLSGKREQK